MSDKVINPGGPKEPFLKRMLDAFGNIFALNVCFLVGCIPVFTIGASLSALYAMCIRIQEEEEETIIAGFVHQFKKNFKQSTIAFFFVVLALIIMYGEFLFTRTTDGVLSDIYTGIIILELILFALVVPFLFPLIARYNNKLLITARNALILALTYKGSWLKVFLAWFAPAAFCVIYPLLFASLWYLWLLIIFGAIAYGTSYTMRKIFRLNEERMEEAARKAKEREENELESMKENELESTKGLQNLQK